MSRFAHSQQCCPLLHYELWILLISAIVVIVRKTFLSSAYENNLPVQIGDRTFISCMDDTTTNPYRPQTTVVVMHVNWMEKCSSHIKHAFCVCNSEEVAQILLRRAFRCGCRLFVIVAIWTMYESSPSTTWNALAICFTWQDYTDASDGAIFMLESDANKS
jgi:hypothetical protein